MILRNELEDLFLKEDLLCFETEGVVDGAMKLLIVLLSNIG